MKICAGIDIGSITTKCVIAKNSGTAGKSLVKTGIDTERCALTVLEKAAGEYGNILVLRLFISEWLSGKFNRMTHHEQTQSAQAA